MNLRGVALSFLIDRVDTATEFLFDELFLYED